MRSHVTNFWGQFLQHAQCELHYKIKSVNSIKLIAAYREFKLHYPQDKKILVINRRLFAWDYNKNVHPDFQHFTGTQAFLKFLKVKPYYIGYIKNFHFSETKNYYWNRNHVSAIVLDLHLLEDIENISIPDFSQPIINCYPTVFSIISHNTTRYGN